MKEIEIRDTEMDEMKTVAIEFGFDTFGGGVGDWR
jgi:hypothetical protein